MRNFPIRSPSAKVDGLVYFGRMLDKIRLHAKGELPAEYQPNLGKGFDGSSLELEMHIAERLSTFSLTRGQRSAPSLPFMRQLLRLRRRRLVAVFNKLPDAHHSDENHDHRNDCPAARRAARQFGFRRHHDYS